MEEELEGPPRTFVILWKDGYVSISEVLPGKFADRVYSPFSLHFFDSRQTSITPPTILRHRTTTGYSLWGHILQLLGVDAPLYLPADFEVKNGNLQFVTASLFDCGPGLYQGSVILVAKE